MKNTKLRKEEGITLVALVITIVVLLILAAVAIVSLSGNNSIITKAQEAKTNTQEAKELEENRISEYEKAIPGNSPISVDGTYVNSSIGVSATLSNGKATSNLVDNGSTEGDFTVNGNKATLVYTGKTNVYGIGDAYDFSIEFDIASEGGIVTLTITNQTWYKDAEHTSSDSEDQEIVLTKN